MHTNGEVRMGTNSAYLAPKGCLKTPNPGLKPWAEIYSPFGAKTSSPERLINGGQFVTCAIGTNTNEC